MPLDVNADFAPPLVTRLQAGYSRTHDTVQFRRANLFIYLLTCFPVFACQRRDSLSPTERVSYCIAALWKGRNTITDIEAML